jgi:hypothetical protein
MTFKFLKIMGIGFILSVKKLLPILFLFTGFQANAVLIGNLTYDGTYISGDGRTYVGLDTIASWDYAKTLAATTEVDGLYEGFRIANTADADYFIGSLFGANSDNCSTVDGTASSTHCGQVSGWADGIFGDSYDADVDVFWFIADEDVASEMGSTGFKAEGQIIQNEGGRSITNTDNYADFGTHSSFPIGWLLVKDTIVQANEPSILALMVLGIFGIGYARRRRQS